MNSLSKWCPLPWIHLATRPNGDVRLCCTANASGASLCDNKEAGLVKDKHGALNLSTHSIEEIWNSDFMKQVRVNMLNDVIPLSCTKCFEEEKNGIVSKRQWETTVWSERVDFEKLILDTTVDGWLPVNIPYFDLRLGNTCQLKCVMCSPHDSSSWIKDWKTQYPLYTNELKVDQQWNTAWNYNWYTNDVILNSIIKQAHNIKELYFAGGEPTIIPEHYKILEAIVDTGNAKSCILRYNSNGIEIPSKLLDLWNHFKEVKFNFSIDAVSDKNEYIRYPSKWTTIEQNLKILDNTPNHIVVNIACAVQLLNINYLPELVNWKLQSNFKKINAKPYGAGLIGMHLVYFPSYLNVRVLPPDIKKQVTVTLNKFMNSINDAEFVSSQYGKQRWEGLVRYMNAEDWSSKLNTTIQYLEICDVKRKSNFRNTFDILSNL